MVENISQANGAGGTCSIPVAREMGNVINLELETGDLKGQEIV